MVRSASSKPLINVLAWLDRWVSEAGRSCCVGRSQTALHGTLSLAGDRAAPDRRGPAAPDPVSRPPCD